jgi:hypothetical protein
MAEIKETHIVQTTPATRRSKVTPWLAFLAGALLIAVIAIFFMNARGSYSGPAGNLDLNIKSPVTTPVTPAR